MDRSVGSPWTRSVVGVRGPAVSVFGLPSAILEISGTLIATNHNHKLDPVGSDDSFGFF